MLILLYCAVVVFGVLSGIVLAAMCCIIVCGKWW